MEPRRGNGDDAEPEVRVVLDLSLDEAEALNVALAFLALREGVRWAAEGSEAEQGPQAALERVQGALEEGIEAARQDIEGGEAGP